MPSHEEKKVFHCLGCLIGQTLSNHADMRKAQDHLYGVNLFRKVVCPMPVGLDDVELREKVYESWFDRERKDQEEWPSIEGY